MQNINLGQKEIVHFIGIGGIGMSGLAKIMKIMNFKVQGSDLTMNKNTENCKKIGIKIFKGHKKKNLKDATIIVRSTAIKNNNVEIKEALKKDIPVYDRAEMLANIVALKKNIVVTGSHGKTTTTSIVAKILTAANLDPTIINGGVINYINTNAKFGKGNWTVLEADESDGSFLKLPINYSIVTNLDKEHLDFYKSFSKLENAFIKFLNKTPPIGKTFVCLDDLNIRKILKKIKIKNFSTFGFNKNADFKILNVRYKKNSTLFNLSGKLNDEKINLKNISINLLGDHNVLNAAAAISLCLNLGIKKKVIINSIYKFSGVQRRMTKLFTKNQNEFYDDYAHHPTEISSVISGVKKVASNRKIVTVFQPHRYSRVNLLKTDFSKAFLKSDIVILCPIYSAGEKKDKKYKSIDFAKLISKNSKTQVIIIKDKIELFQYLGKNLFKDEIVIAMGAGSISNWMKELEKKI